MQNHYFAQDHPLHPYTHSLTAMPGTKAPINALRASLPAPKKGFQIAEKNGRWIYIENHKGEEGYVNGEPYTISDYGPYPKGWSTKPPAPTIAEAKEQKWSEIIAGQADIMRKIKAAYPDDEREGWPFKLPEAEAILAGATWPMPYIDAEFAGSGMLYSSREDLARKVLENNATFKAVSGFINGQQTAMYHALNELATRPGVTVNEIMAFKVKYTLPEGMMDADG